MKKLSTLILLISLLTIGNVFAKVNRVVVPSETNNIIASLDSTVNVCPDESVTLKPNIIPMIGDTFFWTSLGGDNKVIGSTLSLTFTATVNSDYMLTVKKVYPTTDTLVYVFHVNVKPTVIVDMPVSACDEYTWPINDITYYNSTMTIVHGGPHSSGCDSLYKLDLTVNHGWNSVLDTVVCDSYIWNGTTYTQSGVYTYAYISDSGCLNVDTLKLQIKKGWYNSYTVASCENYSWNNKTYILSGDYTHCYTNTAGCPSADTLHLTVNSSSSSTLIVTECDSYNFFGTEYNSSTNSPIFTFPNGNWKGCDSTIHLHLTIRGHKTGTDVRSSCEDYTWSRNGVTYTTTTNTPQAWGGKDNYGCDSLITLNLTIRHGSHNIETVTNCGSYTWHGMPRYVTGNYTYSYTNTQGCPSADTLHLTVNSATSSTITVAECDSYNFFGTEYNSSTNSPFFTFPNGNWKGCDSTIHLHLTIRGHKTGTDVRSSCDNYTWSRNGVTYNASTNNPQAWGGQDNYGCDSLITLNLTIRHGSHNVETVTNCGSYTWHGTPRTVTGNYTYQYTNTQGCPSTDTLHLTVNNATSSTITVAECDSYNFFGTEYNSSTNSPIFTYPNGNWKGCDSTIHLHLTIRGHKTGTDVRSICDSYTWSRNGVTYTTSTNTPQAWGGQDNYGCDSLITLNLTIRHGSHNVETVTNCGFYTWHGTPRTVTGDYTYQYTNTQGCPSADTLHLTVNSSSSSTLTVSECDSYNFFGTIYESSTSSPTFTYPNGNWKGCDSTIYLHLTILGHKHGVDVRTACDSYTWNRDGLTYTTSTNIPQAWGGQDNQGCDSLITLNLTIKHGQSTLETVNACDSYTWQGNTYTTSGTYTIYPINDDGCIDTTTLILNLTESIHNGYHVTACGSYEWDVNGNGQSYFINSGIYYDRWISNGCENCDTLFLTILDYEVPKVETLVQKKHKGSPNPWMLIYPRGSSEVEYHYQWYRNDTLISGAYEQFYQLPHEKAGAQVKYSVMVSSNPMAYCATMSSAIVNFVEVKNITLTTTPNPNNGVFTIELLSTEISATKAEFYNSHGVLVAETPMVDNRVNIYGQLPKGVYVVRIVTENGEYYTDKVVIR